jgi:hypothetical protein
VLLLLLVETVLPGVRARHDLRICPRSGPRTRTGSIGQGESDGTTRFGLFAERLLARIEWMNGFGGLSSSSSANCLLSDVVV